MRDPTAHSDSETGRIMAAGMIYTIGGSFREFGGPATRRTFTISPSPEPTTG
jgi:hypothetical protein